MTMTHAETFAYLNEICDIAERLGFNLDDEWNGMDPSGENRWYRLWKSQNPSICCICDERIHGDIETHILTHSHIEIMARKSHG